MGPLCEAQMKTEPYETILKGHLLLAHCFYITRSYVQSKGNITATLYTNLCDLSPSYLTFVSCNISVIS